MGPCWLSFRSVNAIGSVQGGMPSPNDLQEIGIGIGMFNSVMLSHVRFFDRFVFF